MRDLKPISDDEMILAFIRAEADAVTAPWWSDRYKGANLAPEDTGPNADPRDPEQNRRRREVLARARGYGVNQALFRGLPDDVAWYQGAITIEELADFRHLNYRTFNELTSGSRRIGDGADGSQMGEVNEEELSKRILDLAEAIRGGNRYPALIALAEDLGDPPVIFEGNKRASAYVRELDPQQEVEIIVGVSPKVNQMIFFQL